MIHRLGRLPDWYWYGSLLNRRPYRRYRSTSKIGSEQIPSPRSASILTSSAHDRTWISFRFAVLTEAVAQPVFGVSASLRGDAATDTDIP